MDQELEQTHFDAIILGTGLAESILSASLAKSGRTVLHLDANPYYGGSSAGLSLSELVDWAKQRQTGPSRTAGSQDISKDEIFLQYMLSQQQEYTDIEFDFPSHQDAQTQNEIPTELLKLSRRYCISLDPSFIPAIGPFIEVLLRSGVHRYADFKLLDAIALLETTRTSASEVSRFKRVPMSKEDVFNEKDVSLLDKRRIVKFLQLALGDFEAEIQADENLKNNAELPFSDFLEKQYGLKRPLADGLIHGVALCSSRKEPTFPTLVRLRKYLRCIGKYGSSPFLVPQYGGIGDLIQGFSRICAVHQGIHILDRPIHRLQFSNDRGDNADPSESHQGSCIKVFTGSEPHSQAFTADLVISSQDYLPSNHSVLEYSQPPIYVARGVIILTKPIPLSLAKPKNRRLADQPESLSEEGIDGGGLAEEDQKIPDSALFVIPPSTEGDSVVNVLMMGEGTASCSSGQCILYVSKEVAPTEKDSLKPAREILSPSIATLLSTTFDGPAPETTFSLFYNHRVQPCHLAPSSVTDFRGLHVVPTITPGNLAEGADLAVSLAAGILQKVVGQDVGESKSDGEWLFEENDALTNREDEGE